jgi:hypothetical protein
MPAQSRSRKSKQQGASTSSRNAVDLTSVVRDWDVLDYPKSCIHKTLPPDVAFHYITSDAKMLRAFIVYLTKLTPINRLVFDHESIRSTSHLKIDESGCYGTGSNYMRIGVDGSKFSYYKMDYCDACMCCSVNCSKDRHWQYYMGMSDEQKSVLGLPLSTGSDDQAILEAVRLSLARTSTISFTIRLEQFSSALGLAATDDTVFQIFATEGMLRNNTIQVSRMDTRSGTSYDTIFNVNDADESSLPFTTANMVSTASEWSTVAVLSSQQLRGAMSVKNGDRFQIVSYHRDGEGGDADDSGRTVLAMRLINSNTRTETTITFGSVVDMERIDIGCEIKSNQRSCDKTDVYPFAALDIISTASDFSPTVVIGLAKGRPLMLLFTFGLNKKNIHQTFLHPISGVCGISLEQMLLPADRSALIFLSSAERVARQNTIADIFERAAQIEEESAQFAAMLVGGGGGGDGIDDEDVPAKSKKPGREQQPTKERRVIRKRRSVIIQDEHDDGGGDDENDTDLPINYEAEQEKSKKKKRKKRNRKSDEQQQPAAAAVVVTQEPVDDVIELCPDDYDELIGGGCEWADDAMPMQISAPDDPPIVPAIVINVEQAVVVSRAPTIVPALTVPLPRMLKKMFMSVISKKGRSFASGARNSDRPANQLQIETFFTSKPKNRDIDNSCTLELELELEPEALDKSDHPPVQAAQPLSPLSPCSLFGLPFDCCDGQQSSFF